jgi:hypothetical protein
LERVLAGNHVRVTILLTGLGIIGFGLVLWYLIRYSPWFIVSIGLFNILLGIITPKTPGVVLQPSIPGVKLIVDKAVTGATIYQLVFSDSRLVMKKLTSRGITTGVFVVFAVLGGLVGGLTGVSLEEFIAQRRRNKMRNQNTLTVVGRGDVELPYESMREVQLTGTSLKMVAAGRPLTLHFPKRYAQEIASRLREIIPANCWVGGLVPRPSDSA